MAYVDDLTTIRDNLVAELKGETARRAALVAAGNPPPVTYSAGGKSVQWTAWVKSKTDEIKAVNELIVAEDVYEINEHGY